MASIARSTRQGQGSATTLSGQPRQLQTDQLAQGLAGMQREFDKSLIQKAKQRDKLLDRLDRAKKKQGEYFLGASQAESDKLTDAMMNDVMSGNLSEADTTKRIDDYVSTLSILKRQDDRARDITDQRKDLAIYEKGGLYTPLDQAIQKDIDNREYENYEDFYDEYLGKVFSAEQPISIKDPQALASDISNELIIRQGQESLTGAQGIGQGLQAVETTTSVDPNQVKALWSQDQGIREYAAQLIEDETGVPRNVVRLDNQAVNAKLDELWGEVQLGEKVKQTLRTVPRKTEEKEELDIQTGERGRLGKFNLSVVGEYDSSKEEGDKIKISSTSDAANLKRLQVDKLTQEEAKVKLKDEDGDVQTVVLSGIIMSPSGIAQIEATDKDGSLIKFFPSPENINTIESRLAEGKKPIKEDILLNIAGFKASPQENKVESDPLGLGL